MRSRLLPCLLLTLGSTAAGTAQEYSVATLADSLRQNAQAVVRLYETGFPIQSALLGDGTARHRRHAAGPQGSQTADLVCYVDMFSSLKSLSAEIIDASGRVIRKLGKGDLNYTEYAASGRRGPTTGSNRRYRSSHVPSTTATRRRTRTACSARCVSSRCRPTSA